RRLLPCSAFGRLEDLLPPDAARTAIGESFVAPSMGFYPAVLRAKLEFKLTPEDQPVPRIVVN
ncbi:MAG: hypothetical protein ACLGXA_16395, partial [Acidobacteriota bacterium]